MSEANLLFEIIRLVKERDAAVNDAKAAFAAGAAAEREACAAVCDGVWAHYQERIDGMTGSEEMWPEVAARLAAHQCRDAIRERAARGQAPAAGDGETR